MGLVSEFKAFAMKGNVVDLAVGVIIGGAFGKIVSAMVSDIIMPVIALAMPSGDWRNAGITLSSSVGADGKVVDNVMKIGDFAGTVIDFIILAFVIFIAVNKLMGMLNKKEVAPEAPSPSTKQCPECLDVIPLAAKRCRACTAMQPGMVSV